MFQDVWDVWDVKDVKDVKDIKDVRDVRDVRDVTHQSIKFWSRMHPLDTRMLWMLRISRMYIRSRMHPLDTRMLGILRMFTKQYLCLEKYAPLRY